MTCSALKGLNIDAVWGMVVDYYFAALQENAFHDKRAQQNRSWMHQLVNEMLQLKLSQNAEIAAMIPALEHDVESDRLTAYAAARKIIQRV